MSQFFFQARFRRDHRWAPRQMSAYLDGELSASRHARMERHTEECADCRSLLAGLRLMLSALHRLPAPEGGADALHIVASVRRRLGEPPAS